MIDLQILGTVPRPGKWNWSFGIWFYRKLSGSPRDEKIKHFAKYKCWNFFKLAHFFSHFSQCNPISNIHPKHTDHCFQFFSNQTWSITNITRMPLLLLMIIYGDISSVLCNALCRLRILFKKLSWLGTRVRWDSQSQNWFRPTWILMWNSILNFRVPMSFSPSPILHAYYMHSTCILHINLSPC